MMDSVQNKNRPPHPFIRITALNIFSIEYLIPVARAQNDETMYVPQYKKMMEEQVWHFGIALTMLKILLCNHNRFATKPQLIRAIWPGRDIFKAAHALDVAASILRRQLLRIYTGESLLITMKGNSETSFRLPDQSYLWVDADAFLLLANRALYSMKSEQEILTTLEKAYALVQGPFLESDQSSEWSQKRRQTIEGTQRRALYRMSNIYVRQKRSDYAERFLFEFLEGHPTDEDALCRLMIILAEKGRNHEAYNIYRYASDCIHEEQREFSTYTQALARRVHQGPLLHEQALSYQAQHYHKPALLILLLPFFIELTF
jgi:DNA-binding SARP family transcriptional activator